MTFLRPLELQRLQYLALTISVTIYLSVKIVKSSALPLPRFPDLGARFDMSRLVQRF